MNRHSLGQHSCHNQQDSNTRSDSAEKSTRKKLVEFPLAPSLLSMLPLLYFFLLQYRRVWCSRGGQLRSVGLMSLGQPDWGRACPERGVKHCYQVFSVSLQGTNIWIRKMRNKPALDSVCSCHPVLAMCDWDRVHLSSRLKHVSFPVCRQYHFQTSGFTVCPGRSWLFTISMIVWKPTSIMHLFS